MVEADDLGRTELRGDLWGFAVLPGRHHDPDQVPSHQGLARSLLGLQRNADDRLPGRGEGSFLNQVRGQQTASRDIERRALANDFVGRRSWQYRDRGVVTDPRRRQISGFDHRAARDHGCGHQHLVGARRR